MIALLQRFASGRAVLLAFLALAVGGGALFQLGPYAELRSVAGPAGLPEERSVYDAEALRVFLDVLGPKGRTTYLRFQLLDVVNPLLILAAFGLLMAWMLNRAGALHGPWRLLLLAPLAAAAADLFENVALSLAVVSHPEAGLAGRAAPLLTTMKMAALVATLIAVVACLVVRIRSRRRRAR